MDQRSNADRAKHRPRHAPARRGQWLTVILALVLGSAVFAAGPPGATASAVTPLVIAGDPVAALVGTAPGAKVIYAVGHNLLYRSADGGASWTADGPQPPQDRVVAAGDNPQLLLAGEQDNCARGGGGTPLYRSEDGGGSWQRVAGATGVRPLAIWGAAGVAFGSSCVGMQISTDAGRTWHAAPLTEANYDVTAFAPLATGAAAKPAALIAGTSEGGTSRVWRLDLTNPTRPFVGDVLKEFWGVGALAGVGQAYAIGTAQGVWISDDGGQTWTLRRQGLQDVTISVDPFEQEIPPAEMERGFGINAVAIDPGDTGHLFAATVNGLYETRDAGASWLRIPGLPGKVGALVLAPATGRLFAQTPAGVAEVDSGK